MISAFLKDLPHLADVEALQRDDVSHGALGDYLAHVDRVTHEAHENGRGYG